MIQIGANALAANKAGTLDDQKFAILKKQLADMAGIPLPDLERVVAQQRGPSAMQGIARDEQLRGKQLESLGGLQDIIDQGGNTLDDRVSEEAAISQADSADRRKRAGIASEMQQRGQLDGGARMVMDNMSAQDAANRGRQSGQESAARAQQRKMQALESLGHGAGALRGEDFSEASSKAQAQDAIDAWNAGSRQQADQYNKGLNQQQFNNQVTKVTGQQAGANNLAGAFGAQADLVRGQGAAMGQAAGQFVNGVVRDNTTPTTATYSWDDKTSKDARGDKGGYADLSDPDDK